MNTLTIRLTKGRDSRSVLTCTRPDGSSTWSKVSDYFPTHDLAHYVVETTLGITNGFYGLIVQGWDITAFSRKGAAKQLPPDANLVEALVGRLQADLMPGSDLTAESYNDEVAAVLEGIGNPLRRPVTDQELDAMRKGIRELLARWAAVEPGGALELEWEVQG